RVWRAAGEFGHALARGRLRSASGGAAAQRRPRLRGVAVPPPRPRLAAAFPRPGRGPWGHRLRLRVTRPALAVHLRPGRLARDRAAGADHVRLEHGYLDPRVLRCGPRAALACGRPPRAPGAHVRARLRPLRCQSGSARLDRAHLRQRDACGGNAPDPRRGRGRDRSRRPEGDGDFRPLRLRVRGGGRRRLRRGLAPRRDLDPAVPDRLAHLGHRRALRPARTPQEAVGVSRAGPDVAEERALELRRRKIDAAEVSWRRNGLLLALVFFALTLAGLAATFWLLELWHLPKGWITAALAIVTSEVLIRRYRFFGTGVEAALWLGGLFAWILGLPGKGSPDALLLFAVAAAVAGYRMRNALFGAIASVFVIGYFAARDARGTAAAVGLLVSMAALLVLTREIRRPSTEWLFSALLVITPVAG